MGNDDMRPDSGKRGFPGGFFVFLLALVLVILTVQNLNHERKGKVAFSYQLEHLVNLDLIQKEESRKIALNDNLVSFSGKFKDRQSDEAKTRYRYLELLSRNHELTGQKNDLDQALIASRIQVKEAADLFLQLTGESIPKGGFVVVDPIYNTATEENAIVLKVRSDKEVTSLVDLEQLATGTSLSSGSVSALGRDLLVLIERFRSPALGIGTESIKQQLKTLSEKVSSTLQGTLQGSALAAEQMQTYKETLGTLSQITQDLAGEQQHVRLVQLRSVRSYKAQVEQLSYVSDELERNDAQLDKARQSVANVTWFFNNQELSTRSLEKQDPEAFGHWFAQAQQEWENFSSNKMSAFKAPDQPRNLVLEKTFKSEEPSPNYLSYIFTFLPVILVVLLLYFVFSKQMKGVGGSAMNFGKSPAKMITKDRNKVTFKDVAGCEEAKEELQEIVDFLKDPAKFTALGARIPKGVLMVGAPGTGKTLIAKAIAGEAERPFFFISGSDFVEMFVGVGASRIRDLFDQAKKQAPCIIFIDEIDAVGRHRGSGVGGGHDEREQTLNQLLVEMDGFDTNEGVILIAATNRPDVLDKALLRPGRFDRRVVIDLPDVKGRLEILKVHARKIKLDSSVDLLNIARNTPGSSGADLMNILNEAALLAARKGRSAVTGSDAAEACDKVRYGKERRSLEMDHNEKLTTAYHESGHAIVALFVKHADPVEKVTIIPRGLSLGATHFTPKKNRLSYWRAELLDRLAVLMGGRVAEEIFVGDISSGAQMDITQATRLVRSMVCEWGMTTELGTVAYDEKSEGGQYLGMQGYHEKSYSEATAEVIDKQVRSLVDDALKYARQVIGEHKSQVELMTQMLMEFESLDKEDVLEIMNNTFDIDKKKARLKITEDLQRKTPPPPPTEIAPTPISDTPLSQT
jgi:cell division protease FtsH